MDDRSQADFNSLLVRARQGDEAALGELFTLVYDQLKKIARVQRLRQQEDTLNTTALVHEAFIKLGNLANLSVNDRAHFLAVAATAMRQILIDHARSRLAGKRGGASTRVPFHEIEGALEPGTVFSDGTAHALLALDEALTRLATRSARQSRVVECRFFAGLSIEETAAVLGTSPATVKRDWAMAQSWLYRDLSAEAS